MYHLVLASQSPRRRELLNQAGFNFLVRSPQISEIPNENLNLEDQIQDLAWRKAMACVQGGNLLKTGKVIVLAADTVVVLDGQILGKPTDVAENLAFLKQLSGRTHEVITGVCLHDVEFDRTAKGYERTKVLFRTLRETEIGYYVSGGDGLDKAGGYGIQGEAGQFIESIDGPRDNVMGLPIALVRKLLDENGWKLR